MRKVIAIKDMIYDYESTMGCVLILSPFKSIVMDTPCHLIKSLTPIKIGNYNCWCLIMNYEPTEYIILDSFILSDGRLKGDKNDQLSNWANQVGQDY